MINYTKVFKNDIDKVDKFLRKKEVIKWGGVYVKVEIKSKKFPELHFETRIKCDVKRLEIDGIYCWCVDLNSIIYDTSPSLVRVILADPFYKNICWLDAQDRYYLVNKAFTDGKLKSPTEKELNKIIDSFQEQNIKSLLDGACSHRTHWITKALMSKNLYPIIAINFQGDGYVYPTMGEYFVPCYINNLAYTRRLRAEIFQ